MKPHLQCAEQQVSRSNLTKYCACHAERLAYLVFITYETSFTMRGATAVTIQLHQIYRACHAKWHGKISKKMSKNRWNVISNAGTIREWSENDPTMIRAWKRKPQPASPPRLLFDLTTSIFYCKIQRFAPNLALQTFTKYCACHEKKHLTTSRSTAPATKSDTWTSPSTACTCHEKWHLNFTKYCAYHEKVTRLHSIILMTYETSFTMRGATRCHYPNSPNTAPATQNDHCNIWQRKFAENRWNVISNAGTIRAWSEHDPRMIRAWSDHENANRNPPRKWGYFSSSPGAFSIVKYNVSSPILHSNIHQVLRLPQKVTLDLHRSTAPTTKSNTWTSPNTAPTTKSNTWPSPNTAPTTVSNTWTSPNTAPTTKSNTRTSPSTAPGPATKSDTHSSSSWHMKPHLQCAEQPMSPSKLIQILRLPRKVTRIVHPRDIWNLIYNARSNQCLPPNSPNTAPATQNDHLTCGRNLRKTGETSFPMRGRSEHDPSMIREWSEHDPTMKTQTATRLASEVTFARSPEAFSIAKYNVSRPILHSNIHQVLRLPQKVTLDLHRILPLPRKVTLELHQILPLPRKVTLDLDQVLHLPRKVTFELHLLYYSCL